MYPALTLLLRDSASMCCQHPCLQRRPMSAPATAATRGGCNKAHAALQAMDHRSLSRHQTLHPGRPTRCSSMPTGLVSSLLSLFHAAPRCVACTGLDCCSKCSLCIRPSAICRPRSPPVHVCELNYASCVMHRLGRGKCDCTFAWTQLSILCLDRCVAVVLLLLFMLYSVVCRCVCLQRCSWHQPWYEHHTPMSATSHTPTLTLAMWLLSNTTVVAAARLSLGVANGARPGSTLVFDASGFARLYWPCWWQCPACFTFTAWYTPPPPPPPIIHHPCTHTHTYSHGVLCLMVTPGDNPWPACLQPAQHSRLGMLRLLAPAASLLGAVCMCGGSTTAPQGQRRPRHWCLEHAASAGTQHLG